MCFVKSEGPSIYFITDKSAGAIDGNLTILLRYHGHVILWAGFTAGSMRLACQLCRGDYMRPS